MDEDLLPHESSSGDCSVETQAAPNQETTARAGSVQRPMYVNSEGINARNKSLAQELIIQETGVNVT